MSVSLAGPAGAVADSLQAIKGILGMFLPDKTAEEQQKLAAVLQLVNGQLQIDTAEAQSSDPLQHWRGGMGWVCVAGYAYSFLIQPIMSVWFKVPVVDLGPLAILTGGMLGLGGLHVTERIKGAA